MRVSNTHKELQVSGTHQAVAPVVTWATDHQQRRSGLHQRGERVRLKGGRHVHPISSYSDAESP